MVIGEKDFRKLTIKPVHPITRMKVNCENSLVNTSSLFKSTTLYYIRYILLTYAYNLKEVAVNNHKFSNIVRR